MNTKTKISLAQAAGRAVRSIRRLSGAGDIARVTRRGLRWELDLKEGIDLAIYLLGRFEPATVRAYSKLIRAGDVVIDIGANIGAHTLPLAQAVGPAGSVHAFEPTEFAFAKLCRNIGLNAGLKNRIHARQAMLTASDAARLEPMIYSSWPLADRPPELNETHLGALKTTRGAIATTLDKALAACDRVDLIKIDVDGFEPKVFSGASETLRRHRPLIVCELAPKALTEQGSSLEELIETYLEFGYRLFDEASLAPLPSSPAGLRSRISEGGGINAVAAFQGRLARAP